MVGRTRPLPLLPFLSLRKVHTTFFVSNLKKPPTYFSRPSPPRLPKHLQDEFEQLQKQAEKNPTGNIAADGRELHPDFRRSAPDEFEGEQNPVTGEIGGPKTEPTAHGDWSFNGRVSDF